MRDNNLPCSFSFSAYAYQAAEIPTQEPNSIHDTRLVLQIILNKKCAQYSDLLPPQTSATVFEISTPLAIYGLLLVELGDPAPKSNFLITLAESKRNLSLFSISLSIEFSGWC